MSDLVVLVGALCTAFQDRDGARFASLFTSDATFVTIEGTILAGRHQIESVHATMFAELGHGQFALNVVQVATVGESVTVCHVEWSLNEPAAAGLLTLVPDGSGSAIAVAANVLRTSAVSESRASVSLVPA